MKHSSFKVHFHRIVTDLSVDGGVVGELVFKLLNAFNHLCLVLPVEPFDIFRLLTPSGWPASPAPNSSFCKLKRTPYIVSALADLDNFLTESNFPLVLENSLTISLYLFCNYFSNDHRRHYGIK